MRRAVVFSIDALLAALLLIAGLLLIVGISDHSSDTSQMASAGQDVMIALETITVAEMNDPWIIAMIADGNITDQDITALEQIGRFWALGETAHAQRLAETLLKEEYPMYGLRLSMEGTSIYERPSTFEEKDISAATRMVSGVAEGKAITGSSAVAYLRRIKDKRTSSFTTFGGFVGQGNITVQFLDLPADANITGITLDLATGAPFTVRFNGVQCDGTLTPPDYNGSPGSWDLSVCNGSLQTGVVNNISILFTGKMNESYVAGGFLRVKYKTSTLTSSLNESFAQYHFPGIAGIVNLYDAFYIPGTLVNMTIYLHYNTSNSTYLQIGEKRVWEDAANGTERFITLNDSYLRDPALGKLDYDFLSGKTVPIRMAGFSPTTVTLSSRNADVVIITDFSGSMKKAVSDWDQGNLGGDCESAYTDNDVRRTLLAQCVDKELVDTVLNWTGNRVWPVFLHKDEVKWYNNPSDKNAVSGYIDSYNNGDGKTCIACAINQAYDILDTLSNSSRKKFIVLMTDGSPTHCAAGSCLSTSAAYGAMQCAGMCDVAGQSCGDLVAACTECTANTGGRENALFSAQRARDDLNVTIFTVGFGPVDDCAYGEDTLQQIALIGNGTYQHSRDSAQLRLIYENISQEILAKTTLEAQVAVIQGGESRSRLYEDSYINITYDLATQYLPKQNAISLTLQTPQACNPVVPLYAEQQLVEAKAISYSGTHWSDYLSVNGVEAYNLSNFLVPYTYLGDPSVIQPSISLFTAGDNQFRMETGDSPVNRTGCYQNNSVIYTVVVNLSTERSIVVPGSEGCRWTVQFEDDTFESIVIPAAYVGTNECNYTAASIIYDSEDAYQLGAHAIFNRLDFRKDGKLFVNLQDEDLEVIVTTISKVPYLWGPSMVTLEVIR